MGFFDRIFGGGTRLDERQQAILDVVAASVLADGRIEEVEVGFVLGVIAEMTDGDEDELEGPVEQSLTRVQQEGTSQALIRCAGVLDEEDRVAAFEMALVLHYIDGEVDPAETAFARDAADAFGFSDEEVDDYLTQAESFYEEMAEDFDEDQDDGR